MVTITSAKAKVRPDQSFYLARSGAYVSHETSALRPGGTERGGENIGRFLFLSVAANTKAKSWSESRKRLNLHEVQHENNLLKMNMNQYMCNLMATCWHFSLEKWKEKALTETFHLAFLSIFPHYLFRMFCVTVLGFWFVFHPASFS